MDVMVHVSTERDASADLNRLRAPAGDSDGGDIGSGSARSETNDFRGGMPPDCFGEGIWISVSCINAEGRSPEALDEHDAVPGTDGPGDSERVLESSDCTALVSVPLPSLQLRRMHNARGGLEVTMDGLRSEKGSRALWVSVSRPSTLIGLGLAVETMSPRESDIENICDVSASPSEVFPVRDLLISCLIPSSAASATINPPVRPMPAEQCNKTGGGGASE